MKKKTTTTAKTDSDTKALKSCALGIAFCGFILLMVSGLVVRTIELEQRDTTALNLTKAIADTALSDPTIGLDETILKVSDLFLIEAVLGVKLIEGRSVPLSVGETSDHFPDLSNRTAPQIKWLDQDTKFDVALRIVGPQPFDWFVIRIDSTKVMEPAFFGTAVSWVMGPVSAFIIFIISYLLISSKFNRPLNLFHDFFEENKEGLFSREVPPRLMESKNQWGLVARNLEESRKILKAEKTKADSQIGFLNETPFPLLRCSVNRKVLFANSAARSLTPLFGDETCEFVSPALSEVVRKAFHDTKEIRADIRLGEFIMTFRAIPVLDSGYINLYGEHSRKEVKTNP